MKTFAQKIARLVSAEYEIIHRAGGRSVDEEEIAAFIAEHIRREVRRGMLMVGGECDGEFGDIPADHKVFQAYSHLDRKWDRSNFLGVDPERGEPIKTSFYEIVPIRMNIDQLGKHFDEFKIAAVSGMNPAEMMQALINNYRP